MSLYSVAGLPKYDQMQYQIKLLGHDLCCLSTLTFNTKTTRTLELTKLKTNATLRLFKYLELDFLQKTEEPT